MTNRLHQIIQGLSGKQQASCQKDDILRRIANVLFLEFTTYCMIKIAKRINAR